MRALISGVLAAALGACAPSARDVSIDGLDLADGRTLAALQDALPADDRAALGTYALLHWPKSRFFCGQPIGGRIATAATVGEAIALTQAYEAELAATQATKPKLAAQSVRDEEAALVQQMERLVLERDMLYGEMGPVAAAATPRGSAIKQQLEAIRAQIDKLRQGARS